MKINLDIPNIFKSRHLDESLSKVWNAEKKPSTTVLDSMNISRLRNAKNIFNGKLFSEINFRLLEAKEELVHELGRVITPVGVSEAIRSFHYSVNKHIADLNAFITVHLKDRRLRKATKLALKHRYSSVRMEELQSVTPDYSGLLRLRNILRRLWVVYNISRTL